MPRLPDVTRYDQILAMSDHPVTVSVASWQTCEHRLALPGYRRGGALFDEIEDHCIKRTSQRLKSMQLMKIRLGAV